MKCIFWKCNEQDNVESEVIAMRIGTMKRMFFFLGVLGCAATSTTGYADQDWTNWKKILATDYADRQLGDDRFNVDFTGKQFIGQSALRDLMVLHCSELALAKGYPYFRVVDGHDATGNVFLNRSGISTYMISLHFPSHSTTIQLRSDKQGPQDIAAADAAKLIRREYDLSRFN